MCRIASLFLLQRLKGSMSGDAFDFNNIETRAVIKFIFLQGKAPKEIHVFFLSGLRKLEQRAKKCIELRGEYVGRCSLFHSWSG